MTLGTNSYGTVVEVEALTRVYLKGQSAFNTTTRPTLTEVEKFINRCSGVLNVALSNSGFTIPVSQPDAKLACDNWVVTLASAYVELSQPYAGIEENPRAGIFARLEEEASKWVKLNMAGFGALGVTQGAADSNALIFTGQTVQRDRSDPHDNTLEQPKFSRGMFDS